MESKMLDILGLKINIIQLILPIVYITFGSILFRILKKLILRATTKQTFIRKEQQQKVNTMRSIIVNIIKYTIVIIVLLAILANFGINVKSILAGLGIGTALVGLAFQDLAKDLIAGFSIITEG